MRTTQLMQRLDLGLALAGIVLACAVLVAAVATEPTGQVYPALTGIQSLGLVLACLAGLLHNMVLLRRFGFSLRWYRYSDFYAHCPRWLAIPLHCLVAVSMVCALGLFAMLQAHHIESAHKHLYQSLAIGAFLLGWFALCAGQVVSFMREAERSSQSA